MTNAELDPEAIRLAMVGEEPCRFGDCDRPEAGMCGTCYRMRDRAAAIRSALAAALAGRLRPGGGK